AARLFRPPPRRTGRLVNVPAGGERQARGRVPAVGELRGARLRNAHCPAGEAQAAEVVGPGVGQRDRVVTRREAGVIGYGQRRASRLGNGTTTRLKGQARGRVRARERDALEVREVDVRGGGAEVQRIPGPGIRQVFRSKV